jgi:hypothetical protein
VKINQQLASSGFEFWHFRLGIFEKQKHYIGNYEVLE